MAGIDRRSFKMRMILLAYAGRLMVANAFAFLVVGGMIVAMILLALPGSGKRQVYRATITGLWPGRGRTNPRPTAVLILPDGRHEELRLHNAARCRIGSILLVTETQQRFGSTLDTDPMGCL